MSLTVPFAKRASGSVSGFAFQIGSGTTRLRLIEWRLWQKTQVKHIQSCIYYQRLHKHCTCSTCVSVCLHVQLYIYTHIRKCTSTSQCVVKWAVWQTNSTGRIRSWIKYIQVFNLILSFCLVFLKMYKRPLSYCHCLYSSCLCLFMMYTIRQTRLSTGMAEEHRQHKKLHCSYKLKLIISLIRKPQASYRDLI